MSIRLAVRYMTPVMLLSDGYIANSAEPWLVPDVSKLEPITVDHPEVANGENGKYLPYKRDENLSRPWALPGTPGLMHRIGGLEKAHETGNVNYEPDNHQRMTDLRQAKVDKIADYLPEQTVENDPDGTAEVLLVGWGSTYGSLKEAARQLTAKGVKTGLVNIRFLNPFPRNLGDIFEKYRGKHIVVAELNKGQLRMLLRSKYLVDAKGLNKVQGRPFMVSEVVQHIEELVQKGSVKA